MWNNQSRRYSRPWHTLGLLQKSGFSRRVLRSIWFYMPNEAMKYFNTSGKQIVYSMDEIQNRNTVLCGYWCLYYLLERQMSTSILDVIHNPHFDDNNSDFIQEYFGG